MLKICNELPDMYIIIAFMGNAFAGPRAISHAFLSFKVSISEGEGGLRRGRDWDWDWVLEVDEGEMR